MYKGEIKKSLTVLLLKFFLNSYNINNNILSYSPLLTNIYGVQSSILLNWIRYKDTFSQMRLNTSKYALPQKRYKHKNKKNILNTNSYINIFKTRNLISLYFYDRTNNNTGLGLRTYMLDRNYLISKHLTQVIQAFFGLTAGWKFLNFNFLLERPTYVLLKKEFYKKQILNGLWCKQKLFDMWFVKLIFFKDPWGLILRVNRWVTYSHLKRHKKIFRMLGRFLSGCFFFLFKLNKIKGFALFFKGKLGRKGSVRKSKFFKKQGEVSYSTKKLRVNYRTFQIFTHTGVIGGGISLFFKISFTFCFLYILFYIIVLFLILTFFFVYKTPKVLSQMSFNVYWQGLTYYSKGNFIFKGLVFQLAGFPPMYIFFIKLNYLLIAFYTTTIITCILITVNFLSGMLFYIQLYQTAGLRHDKEVLKLLCENSPLQNSAVQAKTLKRQLHFNILCWSFFFFSAWSYAFLPDIVFCISIFFA